MAETATAISHKTDREEIYKALNQLMIACGLNGEGGTEELFGLLFEAMITVDSKWDSTVGQGHRDNLFSDVNALLAEEIASQLQFYALPTGQASVEPGEP